MQNKQKPRYLLIDTKFFSTTLNNLKIDYNKPANPLLVVKQLN